MPPPAISAVARSAFIHVPATTKAIAVNPSPHASHSFVVIVPPAMKRKRPNASEKIAAALLAIKRGDAWLIPEPLRSTGTAKEICDSVQWDHYPVAVWADGDNRPQNLRPLPGVENLEKGAKVDTPEAAKAKRLRPEHEAFRARMLAKVGQSEMPAVADKPRAKISSRPMPGTKASGMRKRMDGMVERR